MSNDHGVHEELLRAVRQHIDTFGHEGAVWGIYGRLAHMILDGEISEDAAESLAYRLDLGVRFHNDRASRLGLTPDGDSNEF
jgi:hypothetical protein